MTLAADLIHPVTTPDLTTELGLRRTTQSMVVWG